MVCQVYYSFQGNYYLQEIVKCNFRGSSYVYCILFYFTCLHAVHKDNYYVYIWFMFTHGCLETEYRLFPPVTKFLDLFLRAGYFFNASD